MLENIFPTSIQDFTEYFKAAVSKAEANMEAYKILPEKLAAVMPYYAAYTRALAVASDPGTVTTSARRARDRARKALKPVWRAFLDENIRHNPLVPGADLEVFRLQGLDRSGVTPAIPGSVPEVSVMYASAKRLEVEVIEHETGKKWKTRPAVGSFIYVAFTAAGEAPASEEEYRRQEVSRHCRHVVEFPFEQMARQVNIFARYVNSRGEEGPRSAVKTIIIG
jgi:hypothetical protein